MRKFTVPCNFGAQVSPFAIYVGNPRREAHPLQHQSTWLSKERGGSIPQAVMDSLSRLREVAEENGVPFADLCVYALKAAQENPADSGSDQQGGSI